MELSSHVRSSSERNIACGFSGIPSLTRRVSAVTEGRDYRDHTGSKRVSLEDYITLPPSLQRFVVNSSNNRLVSSQLKTALRLVAHDLANVVVHDNNLILRSNQSQSKSPINHHFDVIFSPDSTQQQICSSCLPDLLQSYFNGSDASLLYFGAASKAKDKLLYSNPYPGTNSPKGSASSVFPAYPGVFPATVLLTFRLISELRSRRPDFRYSVRISALHYSQRRNHLSDLLAPFVAGSSQNVTVSEDSALGIKIENHNEIRVDNADQAMHFLNEVITQRTSGTEIDQRCGHLFFYINLYRYKTNSSHVIGGRSRLCLVDLGLGEKSSKGDAQALTMPVITNLLVALFQGQRYLPSRQNPLCMLLKDSLGNIRSKSSLLLTSLSENIAETENILQMVSKLQRATKPRRYTKVGSDCSSSASSRRRANFDADATSSSEQSCAETVIFLGPSVKGEPIKQSSKVNSNTIDNEKRRRIMEWMDNTTTFGEYQTPNKNISSSKADVEVQCNENDIDYELLHHSVCIRPLDDIIEDDEECLANGQSSQNLTCANEYLENFDVGDHLIDGKFRHSLSILSRELLDKISASSSTKSSSENDMDDDDLEKAMAASVSSIRSHEILSRLRDEPNNETNGSNDTSSGVEVYQKAQRLEEYASEKIRQLDEASVAEKKKRKKSVIPFNCCQGSMQSSDSSSGFTTLPPISTTSAITNGRRKPLLDTSELYKTLPTLASTSKSFNVSPTSICQVAQQLAHFAIKSSKSADSPSKSRLPKKIDSSTIIRSSSDPYDVRCPIESIINARTQKKEFIDNRKENKRSKRSTESKRNPSDPTGIATYFIPSPYSKITEAKADTGTYSSGHGSDENGSVYSRRQLSLLSPRVNRPRNRESYSASSGYESASGDYKSYAALSKKRIAEYKQIRLQDTKATVIGRRIGLQMMRQKKLREQLREAKLLIGCVDERFVSASASMLDGATLLEALTQENRILEKRLTACRNHVSLVTCLL